jgi:hypothetical protein
MKLMWGERMGPRTTSSEAETETKRLKSSHPALTETQLRAPRTSSSVLLFKSSVSSCTVVAARWFSAARFQR